MKGRLIFLVTTCLSLIAVVTMTPAVQTRLEEINNPQCETAWNATTDPNFLKEVAKAITVKVLGENSHGSGTLVRKEEDYYFVLTNHHVVRSGSNYLIQTSDGKVHIALALPIDEQERERADLALLVFQSDAEYTVATVAPQSTRLFVRDKVFATGFLYDEEQLTFTEGSISQLSEKAFKGGYQIGYTNQIEKGMSGGPLLNRHGELIGINGMLAYPPFGNPYVFTDGTEPTDVQREEMMRSSWGISIQTLTRLAPRLILPDLVREVDSVARNVTVYIQQPDGGNGSGVIIGKKDGKYSVYTILTNDHVLDQEGSYEILTYDGQCYPVKSDTVKRLEGLDVGVLQFSSKQDYQVAALADYDLESQENRWAFVSGWLKSEEDSITREFEPGLLLSTQKGSFAVKNSASQTMGYELVYTNRTSGGMSGGPIFDTLGRVIGIHGRADGDRRYNVQLGYSLGVPVRNFIDENNDASIKEIQKNAPPRETDEETELIRDALLPPEEPSSDARVLEWLNYGNKLWRLFYYEDAVAAFNRAIELEPDLAIAYYAKGVALKNWGKYQESYEAFVLATQKDEKFYEAWREKSTMLLVLQRNEEALVSINKAIELNPDDSNLYLQQGDVLKTLNRFSEAENAYGKAIDINPLFNSYIYRASIRSMMGDKTGAMADFNKAIEINHNSSDAYISRAIFRYDTLEDIDGGEADFAEAIKIKPDYDEAYYRRGTLRYNWENYQGAVEDYTKVLEIFPEYAAAYYDRGLAYRQLGNKQAAMTDFDKAAELSYSWENQELYQQAIKRNEELKRAESITALYEGQALEKSVQSTGKISLGIYENDSLSDTVKVRLVLSKGLIGEGELEGKKKGNVIEVSGLASTGGKGAIYYLVMRFEMLDNQTIKGTYGYSPTVGYVDIKDEAEFTATLVNSDDARFLNAPFSN